jgi:hypothetical protein
LPKTLRRYRIALLVGCLWILGVPCSGAQVIRAGARSIAPKAPLLESITLILSGNAVNFALSQGSASNPGSTSIVATTAWILEPSRGNLNVYAYFSSSAAALGDGAGNNIPSSSFQISDNGAVFAPLTNTVPFGGPNAGLQLATVRILGNNKTGSRTDVMNFNINLSPLPTLPASVYTGTLTIQVQAI